MRRLLFSAFVVVVSSAAIAAGATGAFFSDTEISLGNMFTAGQIDLKVDNDSYYNGNRCALGNHDNVAETPDTFAWVGAAAFPVPGTPCDTSWPEADLNDGVTTLHKFFNFLDVKPSDDGEDTISLHVQNDAWMCMDVTLKTNDDFSTNEPEGLVDVAEDSENDWDGELAQAIQMFWWADDGDNVYETGEPIFSGLGTVEDGVETLYDLATTSPFQVALADAQNNAWGEVDGTPMPAGTSYIAKAWCFGALDITPLAEGDGGPQVRGGGGYTCDGDNLGNITQTDRVTLDVAFRAVQARHNDDFICNPPTMGTITVRKAIESTGDPTPPLDQTAFAPYMIDGNPIAYGTPIPVTPGPHTVSETNIDEDYVASFSLDCDVNGVVNVIAGDDRECIITNTYAPQCVLTEGNLVTNGGFESPEVSTAQNWNVFPSVAGGWSVVWRADVPASFGAQLRPATANLELHENVLGTAFEGDQYTELDSDWGGPTSAGSGEPASTHVSQAVTTVPGAGYTVSFAWAPRPSTVAAQNRVQVRWDGNVIYDSGNVGDANAGIGWVPVGPINVVAADASSVLEFIDLGVANSNGTFIDAVDVRHVTCDGSNGNTNLGEQAAVTGAVSFFSDGFGAGGDDNDIDNWDEQGTEGDSGTRGEDGAGADGSALSPNGGRLALIDDNEWICRSITATTQHTMALQYYWMGDNEAEDGESATVQYYTGGSCDSPTGLTTLATHELDNGDVGAAAWSSLQSVNLPASLNGTTFFIRFTNGDQSAADEDFRVDGINVTGIATN